jgi:ribonuclease VapC
MPARLVLDSFALMALFQDEPGAARVQELLQGASRGEHELYMSVISLGEVLYTIEDRQSIEAAQRALAFIDQSPVKLVDVDRSLALAAARLKAATGLGYADCFVGACAQLLDAAVVTGDLDFRQVENEVALEWLPATEPG